MLMRGTNFQLHSSMIINVMMHCLQFAMIKVNLALHNCMIINIRMHCLQFTKNHMQKILKANYPISNKILRAWTKTATLPREDRLPSDDKTLKNS